MARAVDSYYGVSAGLSFSFGNKANRIGVLVGGYYTYGFVQLNGTLNGYYNFQSLGTKLSTPELQLGIGAEFGFGNKDSLRNEFIGLTENNLQSTYSIGYSYLYYFDKIETSQGSGIISLTLDNFKIATENDLFGAGKGWRDRFRTGAVLLEYQYLNTKFSINSTLWTGDFTGCMWIRDSDYPGRFGYRENDKSICGDYSLGLLSIQVQHLFPYQQIGRINIGIDSEKIRHTFQNKLIHDQPFFKPQWVKRKPPHIPMIDSKGDQYLFKEGQKIRPPTFYFNIGGNNNPFY